MRKLEYQISFTTPAFLGNAEQVSQWRTPPFKALLRQWWRIVNAKSVNYDHGKLRQSEGMLFGNSWLHDNSGRCSFSKSEIRLRLSNWNMGSLEKPEWPGGPIEKVTTTADQKASVRADLYLGFGPVLPPSRKEGRRSIELSNSAVGPSECALLSIWPDTAAGLVDMMHLVACFGTVGSRSRNGWGSLELEPVQGLSNHRNFPRISYELGQAVSRDWRECMNEEWPHAIGTSDGKPLVWRSGQIYPDWRKAIGALANVRVEARRIAKKFVGPSGIGGIHLLGYPAGGQWTLHELKKGQPTSNADEARMASQLRFKVRRVPGGCQALVFHIPHRFPDSLRERLNAPQQRWLAAHEEEVWFRLHAALDMMPRLTRFSEVLG